MSTAGPSRPMTLAATVAAAGIVQLPTAAIVVAVPTIHAEFGTSIAELQWTVTAFMIPFAAFLIAAGRIADVFGRKRLLLVGTTIFAVGAVLAAIAPGVGLLIAGLALAGAGSAAIMPSSMGVLVDVFTGAGRGTAIGLWGAATELVSGVGVLVGGVLTGALDWRWIFVVCLAIAVAVALLAWRGAPESRDPGAPRQIDLLGAALSASALTALTLALIQGASWGWASAAVISLLVAAVALAAALALVERRTPNPLFDVSMLRRRNFSGSLVVIFVLDFSFGALLFFLPLYFQEILDYSATEVGVLLLPLTGLMVVGSPLGGQIAARVGPRPPIAAGLGMMAIAVWLISGLSPATDYADLWLPTALMGLGVGLALTPMNLAAMNAVSPDHAGSASGVLVTLSGLGATLGVAVTGAAFNELFADRTVSDAGAVGVEVSRSQAQSLDGVLAGTESSERLLHRLADGSAEQLREAVRDAFVSSLGTSLKVSAGLILVGLLLSTLLMRRSSPVDARTIPPVPGGPTPRPAPRRIDPELAPEERAWGPGREPV